jgi:hypothetical protein
MNKRGWIRIVEAFIAVLLIAGVLLFVINRGYIGTRDISEQVYEAQLAILREIELNSDYRLQILEEGEKLKQEPPVEPLIPAGVSETIEQRMPDYLECVSRICNLEKVCPAPEGVPIERDIYAQAVAISAEGTKYGPVQLKLFCWTAG